MHDMERDGFHFYSVDNGQAAILFYLDDPTARRLGELSANPLERVMSE